MSKKVLPKEAFELMQQGCVYVDVRSTPEFERGHPAGAVHVPLMEAGAAGLEPNPQFVEQFARAVPDRAAQVIIGCEAGGRSARAVAILQQQGYTGLVDQCAGFGGARRPTGEVERGWRDEGLPVETGTAR